MNSGVYCLRFSDGSEYVGKSVDIDRRLKEHADKLRTGTAAKLLQAAYNKFGYPNYGILVKCHPDHIDLMETYYICVRQPVLNAVGGLKIDSEYLKVLERYPEFLEYSTAEHIVQLLKYKEAIDLIEDSKKAALEEANAKIKQLQKEIDTLLDEELRDNNLARELQEAKKATDELISDYGTLVDEHEELLNMPFWKRLFNWPKK